MLCGFINLILGLIDSNRPKAVRGETIPQRLQFTAPAFNNIAKMQNDGNALLFFSEFIERIQQMLKPRYSSTIYRSS